MKLNPALEQALEATTDVETEVMPTAPILREEARLVNEQNTDTPASPGTETKRKRGRPRKDGSTGDTVSKSRSFVGGAGAAEIDKDAATRAELSKQVVVIVEQSGCMLAGDAARMADGEKIALSSNLDNYMKSKNINDIPPGLLLAMGLSMYYARVLSIPDKRDNIPVGAKVMFWIKQKFNRKKNARTHNGHDGQRQDNAGETSGQKV